MGQSGANTLFHTLTRSSPSSTDSVEAHCTERLKRVELAISVKELVNRLGLPALTPSQALRLKADNTATINLVSRLHRPLMEYCCSVLQISVFLEPSTLRRYRFPCLQIERLVQGGLRSIGSGTTGLFDENIRPIVHMRQYTLSMHLKARVSCSAWC